MASLEITAKTTLLPHDHIQLALYNDKITFVFTTADGAKYHMPISKGSIETTSQALHELVIRSNTSQEIEIPQFSKYSITNNDSILLILTQYLQHGWPEEFDSYTVKHLQNDPKKLEDLFCFARFLADFDIEELGRWTRERILTLIQKNSSSRDFVKSCLMLAIQNKLDNLVSGCMPIVLGHYWTAQHAGWQQVSIVMERVITRALPDGNPAIESINIVGYSSFQNCQNKPLPGLFSKLFPNLRAVKFYSSAYVPCILYVERNNNVLTFAQREGKWLTNERQTSFPNTLPAHVQLPEAIQSSAEVEEDDSQEVDEIESFSAESDDDVNDVGDSLNDLQINDQEAEKDS